MRYRRRALLDLALLANFSTVLLFSSSANADTIYIKSSNSPASICNAGSFFNGFVMSYDGIVFHITKRGNKCPGNSPNEMLTKMCDDHKMKEPPFAWNPLIKTANKPEFYLFEVPAKEIQSITFNGIMEDDCWENRQRDEEDSFQTFDSFSPTSMISPDINGKLFLIGENAENSTFLPSVFKASAVSEYEVTETAFHGFAKSTLKVGMEIPVTPTEFASNEKNSQYGMLMLDSETASSEKSAYWITGTMTDVAGEKTILNVVDYNPIEFTAAQNIAHSYPGGCLIQTQFSLDSSSSIASPNWDIHEQRTERIIKGNLSNISVDDNCLRSIEFKINPEELVTEVHGISSLD